MKTISIYDPPMCCSSGVCGPDVDPLLPLFAGLLAQMRSHGVKVERFNLAQQPLAFAQNTEVRAILEKEGVELLPLVFIDGSLEIKGHYPEAEERAALMKRLKETASIPSATES
jgi:hypothetical protein